MLEPVDQLGYTLTSIYLTKQDVEYLLMIMRPLAGTHFERWESIIKRLEYARDNTLWSNSW